MAWEPLGWKPAFFAEVEPFPCALLAERWPEVPNLGDVTAPDFAARARSLGPVDLVVGGSPCQAFSLAGLRRSLGDARGNLTLRYVEIVDALDPEYIVWENVAGVLDVHDNAFGCFLAGLVGESDALLPPGRKWPHQGVVSGPRRTVAWGLFDARGFGVPQARRRVVLLGVRAGGGLHPAEILLVGPREAGARGAGGAPRSRLAGVDGGRARDGGGDRPGARLNPREAVVFNCKQYGSDASSEWAPTLRAMPHDRSHANGGGQLAVVYEAGEGPVARRLTPLECERLQGMPDNHTLIGGRSSAGWRKDEVAGFCRYFSKILGRVVPPEEAVRFAADGVRYKAIGNSIPIPMLSWLGAALDAGLDAARRADRRAGSLTEAA